MKPIDLPSLLPPSKNSEELEILLKKEEEAKVFSYDSLLIRPPYLLLLMCATHLIFCRVCVCFVVEEGLQTTEGTDTEDGCAKRSRPIGIVLSSVLTIGYIRVFAFLLVALLLTNE